MSKLKKELKRVLKLLFIYRNYQFLIILIWFMFLNYIPSLNFTTFEKMISIILCLIGFQTVLFWWLR